MTTRPPTGSGLNRHTTSVGRGRWELTIDDDRPQDYENLGVLQGSLEEVISQANAIFALEGWV